MKSQKILTLRKVLVAAIVTCVVLPLAAQKKRVKDVPPTEDGGIVYTASELAKAAPVARSSDVSSPEALLSALHDSVSGPAGPVDWNRFRSLFLPSARLGSSTTDSKGVARITLASPEELIKSGASERERVPWYEVILVKRIQRFDNIAVAYYSHDNRSSPDGGVVQQSVNVCEMLYDGTRWWILSDIWNVVPKSTKLPPDLDPKQSQPR
jgi:hypothetical protein